MTVHKYPLCLAVMVFILYACQLPIVDTPPILSNVQAESILHGFIDAQNAGNVEGALAFLADNAVIQLIPPPIEGNDGIFTGKEEIRAWYENLAYLHGMGNIRNISVEGDQVTALLTYTDDSINSLGIEAIENLWVVNLRDSQIQRYTATLTAQSLAALEAAMSKPLNLYSHDEIEEWVLVYISDSTGWGVSEKFAKNIERDTGKTVRIHDYAIGNLSAIRVLQALQSDPESLSDFQYKSFQAHIAEAEVIVFFANPRGDPSLGGVIGGMEKCINSSLLEPEDCTIQLYKPYIENLKIIYKEIFALRNGKPTIIRAVDFYNPLISRHREGNIEIECTQCWETFNTAIQQAAQAYNIPLISVYDSLNGISHNEDPREKGFIGSDGIHTSEKGQQVIADLLSAAGYEAVQL